MNSSKIIVIMMKKYIENHISSVLSGNNIKCCNEQIINAYNTTTEDFIFLAMCAYFNLFCFKLPTSFSQVIELKFCTSQCSEKCEYLVRCLCDVRNKNCVKNNLKCGIEN